MKNVLVIGSGIRELAVINKLSQSPAVNKIFCVPGNNEISKVCTVKDIDFKKYNQLIDFVKQNNINMVLMGSYKLIFDGLPQHFQEEKIPVLFPKEKLNQLANSRLALKKHLQNYSIPIITGHSFDNMDAVIAHAQTFETPYVIKTDAIMGSRTSICNALGELDNFLMHEVKEKHRGEIDIKVMFERFAKGPVFSIPILIQGKTIIIFPFCLNIQFKSDIFFKGFYTSPSIANQKLRKNIEKNIIVPLVHSLKYFIGNYSGFITVDVLVENQYPYVADINFELKPNIAQIILHSLKSDLFEIMLKSFEYKLYKQKFSWSKEHFLSFLFHNKNQEVEKFCETFSNKNLDELNILQGNIDLLRPKRVSSISFKGKDLDGIYNNAVIKWQEAKLPEESSIIKKIGQVKQIIQNMEIPKY